MTGSEVIVFFVAPILLLAVFFVLQERYSDGLRVAFSAFILGLVAIISLLSAGSWIVPTVLIGGASVTTIWLLRGSFLVDRPLLQLLLGIPFYLASLMVLASIAVMLGWISP